MNILDCISKQSLPKVSGRKSRCGLTLLELLVVVTILIAAALIAIPSFNQISVVGSGGETQCPVTIATRTTMHTVRNAIAGENGVMESLSHKPNALPREVSELVQEEPPELIKETAPQLMDYDPVNRVGWNGPYVHPTGTNATGKPTVVDGWGNELKIQIDFDEDGRVDPTESKFIRIVSAGPNGEFDTPADITNMKPGKDQLHELTRAECGDDLVVFVRFPDNRQ